ncbi:Nuclear pore complex protein NUP50B [Hirschfeldia incana]|nr:Nuclear pore complex protein NUP50B [Hirschfeldia incana]KAJ0249240.1 Nuclear pore complex protein NUP50B [Hirschfeldia incana]
MGDSENAHPPSKKRGALKELSRDNPGLDDDSDDDTSAFQSGTFKTASEEVLATRRIVRDPSSAQQPSSNLFAGICFATAPHAVTNKPLSGSNSTPDDEGIQETEDDGRRSDAPKEVIDVGETKDETKTVTEVEDAAGEETEKAKDENSNINSDKGSDSVDKSEAVNGGVTAKDKTKTTTIEVEVAAGEETQKVKDDKESDCGVDQTEKEGTDDNGDNSGAFTAFHQYSTSKNAFTVFAGTGSVSLTEPSSFSFNGIHPIFNSSGSASITTAFPSKEDVSVETGEENEETVFTAADSVMFEYFVEGGWKERGKGEVKVNVSTTDSRKARLLMRSKGTYRLILNASLYPEMKLAGMDYNELAFACVNGVTEAKSGLSVFALKFKDPAIVEVFREVIEEHKESKPVSVKAAAASLKTPENSPSAEEDA